MKLNTQLAFGIATLSLFGSSAAFGQAATGTPAFEVASVKRSNSGGEPSADARDGRFTTSNMPLKFLIMRAYRVPKDKIAGPAWLDTDGFDIVAKIGPDATAETLPLMLQNLLAERFKLAIHREQTPMPVYALVVGPKGPKLQEASAESQALEKARAKCSRQAIQITCQNWKSTMADLAENLPRWTRADWFDRPIVDQTGLKGVYDFTLKWTMTKRVDDTAGDSDPDFVSIFDAIQDQLGLRLERSKAALDRLVIDHVERIPVEN